MLSESEWVKLVISSTERRITEALNRQEQSHVAGRWVERGETVHSPDAAVWYCDGRGATGHDDTTG